MIIVIDDREHALISALDNGNISHTVKRLDLGDIHFATEQGIQYIIERKTLEDLNASIKDGRWREQKIRLSESGIPFSILIESRSRITDNNLGALLNTIILDKMTVLRSHDVDDTASILKQFANKLNQPARSLPIAVTKKRTNGTIWQQQLMCVPGISLDLAMRISAEYPTIRDLVKSYEDIDEKKRPKLLCSIEKIGPTLSKRVFNSLFHSTSIEFEH